VTKLRLLLHYPDWGNRWIPYIKRELETYDLVTTHTTSGEELGELSERADLLMSMWADASVVFWSNYFADKPIITYLRRYEMWTPQLMKNIRWDAVNAVIFVSDYYRQALSLFADMPENKKWLIPNGIDLSDFPLCQKEAYNPHSIAMVCSVRDIKNFPLACQILMSLPDEYRIHQIGLPFSDGGAGHLYSYIRELGLWDRFVFNGSIPKQEIPKWLSDKCCILSTSINEGNPHNVIEAMAMGIQPVIHAWPGAAGQFPYASIFHTVKEAVGLITRPPLFGPEFYRSWVEERYSLDNFKKIHEVIDSVMTGGTHE